MKCNEGETVSLNKNEVSIDLLRSHLDNYDSQKEMQKLGTFVINGIEFVVEKLRPVIKEYEELRDKIEQNGIISIDASGALTDKSLHTAVDIVVGHIKNINFDSEWEEINKLKTVRDKRI